MKQFNATEVCIPLVHSTRFGDKLLHEGTLLGKTVARTAAGDGDKHNPHMDTGGPRLQALYRLAYQTYGPCKNNLMSNLIGVPACFVVYLEKRKAAEFLLFAAMILDKPLQKGTLSCRNS